MDSNFINKMVKLGGTLVVLDMPPGIEFGIDLESWNVGKRFNGVKMIPPGLHFIHFSSMNLYGQKAPRTGFFHYFKEKEVLVKKYCVLEENIYDEEDADKVERIKQNLRELDRGLGPFPFESWPKWISFSQHINEINLQRLQPLSKSICSAPELINKNQIKLKEENKPSHSSDTSAEMEEGSVSSESNHLSRTKLNLPDMVPVPGTEIRFCKFPDRPYKEGATPAEVSKGSMDSSFTMQYIFGQLDTRKSVLAELQFSFLCFLVGQLWDAWEHWRKLITAVCRAEETLLQNPSFYSNFLSILHYQIQEVPEDLFADIVESTNFLADSLSNLFANIHDNAASLPVGLVSKADKFKGHLRNKFKWALAMDLEEDQPVVVET